jgi:polyhydroxyalkanoate synthesis regulator phasin
MNTRMKKYGVIVGAALVGVLTFSAISFAQTPDTSTSSTPIMERIQQGVQNAFERGGPGGRGGHGERGEHQEDLAAALGMTTEELQTAIQSGLTIEEIAAEKGVDLQAFALAQAQEKLAQAVTDGKLTQEEADAKLAEIQTAIENGEFPGQRGFGPDGSGSKGHGPRGERNGALAEALGMTPEELHTALDNGQTIEEIAAEKGVDLEAFKAAQQAEHLAQAQERLAQAVADGKLTQEEADAKLAEIQTAIQNGERPEFGGQGGPGGHGPRGGRDGGRPNFDGQRGPRGGQNNAPADAPANPNL